MTYGFTRVNLNYWCAVAELNTLLGAVQSCGTMGTNLELCKTAGCVCRGKNDPVPESNCVDPIVIGVLGLC